MRFCVSSKRRGILTLPIQGPPCIAGVKSSSPPRPGGLNQNHLPCGCLKCRLLGCPSVLWDQTSLGMEPKNQLFELVLQVILRYVTGFEPLVLGRMDRVV